MPLCDLLRSDGTRCIRPEGHDGEHFYWDAPASPPTAPLSRSMIRCGAETPERNGRCHRPYDHTGAHEAHVGFHTRCWPDEELPTPAQVAASLTFSFNETCRVMGALAQAASEAGLSMKDMIDTLDSLAKGLGAPHRPVTPQPVTPQPDRDVRLRDEEES